MTLESKVEYERRRAKLQTEQTSHGIGRGVRGSKSGDQHQFSRLLVKIVPKRSFPCSFPIFLNDVLWEPEMCQRNDSDCALSQVDIPRGKG